MRGGLTGRMVVASGCLAIIVGGAFAVVLLAIDDLRGTTDLRRQTREELVAAETLEKQIIDVETGLRGFVITRDDSFLEPSDDARAALPASARTLERLAAEDPVQVARVRRIVRAMNAYISDYAVPLVSAVRRNDPSVRSVESTVRAKQRVDALRAGLNSFSEAERARLSTRDEDVDQASRRATAAAAVGVGGSVALIILFSGYLTRVIVRPLRGAAAMANRLAGGDLSARMRETDIAEIGELERSFNVMAGSLETSRDELAALLAEQGALRRLATLVASGAAPTEVFAVTAREVCRLLGTNATALCRYGPDATVTVLALETDVDLGVPVGARITLEGENAMGAVLRTRRAARVESFARTTGQLAEIAHRGGMQSSVGAPILVEGGLWGVVVVSSSSGPLPADTEQRLADFTELVATAIANADARAEVERLADEQAALRRVATLVAEGPSAPAVFDAVAGEMERLLAAHQVALNRFEPSDEIVVLAHRGLDVERTPVGSRVSIDGESATARVRRTGRPARVESYEGAEGALAELARATGLRSSVSVPIVVEGELWGLITASWKGEQPPPADTEERMARFAQLLDTAIANAEARDQLMASRARLVTASDDARRRFERDLHDGIQQRLVSLSLEVRGAEAVAPRESEELAGQLAQVGKGLAEALDDLRELSRGIHPAVLSKGGLVPALKTLVRRSSIPVDLDLAIDERLADHVEVGAYYVVSEALTNVAKHSEAGSAAVRVWVEDGVLHLDVRDDGVGGARKDGTGLLGLNDRLAALGGRLRVESPPGGGTQIAATLPLGNQA